MGAVSVMPRLANAKLIYLSASETFYFQSRELPVFDSCNDTTNSKYYCISHKQFFNTELEYETHIEHASTHELVSYCGKHERFEEV